MARYWDVSGKVEATFRWLFTVLGIAGLLGGCFGGAAGLIKGAVDGTDQNDFATGVHTAGTLAIISTGGCCLGVVFIVIALFMWMRKYA